jgi:hypothetical protein
MPSYKVTDPQSGRTVTLRGDGPPTAAELESIFANLDGARAQANERPAEYLRETISNIPRDAVRTGKDLVVGAGRTLATLSGAAAEVGSATGNALREVVGLEPHYQGTENLQAVGRMVPGVIAHYGGYLDPEERARRVRDNPVATVLDVLPVGAATKAAAPAALRGVKAAASNPAVRGAVAGAALDLATGGATGGMGTVGGIATGLAKRYIDKKISSGVDAIAEKAAAGVKVSPKPAPEVPTPTGGVDSRPIAAEEVANANRAAAVDNPMFRPAAHKGFVVQGMSPLQVADRIKELKVMRPQTTDSAVLNDINAELAVMERAHDQFKNVTHSTQLRNARKGGK